MKRKLPAVILRAVVSYDGGAYFGWQTQPGQPTVQEHIEAVLKRLCCKAVAVHGASRTDQGVHALGMVAHFCWTGSRLGPSEIQRACNALLPTDIRILKIDRAPPRFHARFQARSKLYRYRILTGRTIDPFRRSVTWHIPKKLDLQAVRRAARHFVGRHDFSAVAVNPGYARASMVRTIHRCAVRKKGDEIQVEVEGDGFLYKMVRSILGTLVDVGWGRRDPDSIPALLKSRDRQKAGRVAPAHGLFLVKVKY